MKKSPVTGELVPDETHRVAQEVYVNPRKAEWPTADFIVGNPPFLGAKNMLAVRGDGYVNVVRQVHPEVPDAADYVMNWWSHAAQLVASGKCQRSGLITTNSIWQEMNRRIVGTRLDLVSAPVSILFAIPDHPWSEQGADVRVAMTVVGAGAQQLGVLVSVTDPKASVVSELQYRVQSGVINAALRIGMETRRARASLANAGVSFKGMMPYGGGFWVDRATALQFQQDDADGPKFVRPYRNGRDLASVPRDVFVLDFHGLMQDEVQERFPSAYQHLLSTVKPERDQNRDRQRREKWWLFGRSNESFRLAAHGLRRIIVTTETSKHRVFQFLDSEFVPDQKLRIIAMDDAWIVGVLSSRPHLVWALAAGGRMGVGNDPVYMNTLCFDPFPFPAASDLQKARIRKLGEQLDAHRKRQQALHAGLTITGMYNVLEKLRSGETLAVKDKQIHTQGLVSILQQIHDDLDAAVFDAYGWPRDLTNEQILEKLVALNAERAEEERNGHVRWLRPDFQNPGGAKKPENLTLAGTDAPDESDETDDDKPAPAATAATWPKRPGERIAAIRDLVVASKRLWRTAEVAGAFKGSKKKDVADLLDSLAGIGVLAAYGETEKELRWGVPTRATGG